jgi:hypothetical protein
MNRRWMLLLLGVGMLLLPAFGAGPQEDAWKQVDQAMTAGLPKTAIERLEPIIRAALAEKKYAEAIKAITTKIALEGNIQGNKPEERITRLQAAIETAPPEMQPMMEAVLANWYWHYFRQNSWRFMRRTATSEPPGEDFTTWDLPRLFAEIDRRFTKALAASDALKKIPVADYDDLLVQGTMPDRYRPTLYDFVVYNALEFYTAGEQAAAKPQDAFQLMADSPIFSPADQFVGLAVKNWAGSARRRRGFAGAESHPVVPGPASLASGRRRSVGLPACRPRAAGVRLEQGVWRGKERPLQSRH